MGLMRGRESVLQTFGVLYDNHSCTTTGPKYIFLEIILPEGKFPSNLQFLCPLFEI